jgi:hypothetical protein
MQDGLKMLRLCEVTLALNWVQSDKGLWESGGITLTFLTWARDGECSEVQGPDYLNPGIQVRGSQ